ncbi:MAG: flagellar basal-body MS-ring/collar protein FliF [Pseudomonadota bacterium]
MSSIVQNLKALGGVKLSILALTFAGTLGAVLFGLGAVMAPTYAALYSELSPASASRIVSSLEQAGFRVRVSPDGSLVSVPQEDIPRARMVLADSGLPNDGMPGWELFDGANGMGMNTFLQKVTRLRALEGELARSIQTINGIEAARVHLVLPEREAFARHRPEPSASVIISAGSGGAIGRRQGAAIRALVASAVPDLVPQRVTVLSANGETILGDDADGAGESALHSRQSEIEDRIARKITDILNARVGVGNARVEVNVDLSTVRQVTRSERFDPEGQVVRSTETREQTSRDQQPGGPEVGTAGNLPPFDDGAVAGSGAVAESQVTGETINYEIASTLTETVAEPGAIQRISVAALVDGVYSEGDDEALVYAERDEAELERLAQLIRAAIGFDAARGDIVSVDSLQFVTVSHELDGPIGGGFGQAVQAYLPSVLRGLFALVLVVAVLAFGVRPVVRMLLEAPQPNAQLGSDGADPVAIADGGAQVQQLTQGDPSSLGQPGMVLAPGATTMDDTVQIAAVQGGVSRHAIESAGGLVTERPELATQAVQSWLSNPA